MPQAQLHRLVASRDVLRSRFESVWARLPKADPSQLDDWSRAAIELAAHLDHPVMPQAVGSLKPLQLALIALIEDARVEALAIRRFPGLWSVWTRLHTVMPTGPRTATNLMARLSRALLDPAYEDQDGFVAKGRGLFADAAALGLDDAAAARQIGRALGHDLGQMRVQFNWREYVVQPAYRDDGQHLWQGREQEAAPVEVVVQAGGPAAPGTGSGPQGDPPRGRARAVEADERGPVIATGIDPASCTP